ncbi:MAG: GYD domain-containing protein [Anaerolineae bacterium]|nr:GYD domain-containing protein [Anaerolineae bacterium]
MATYLMFGKYSIDALGKISAERTKNATAIIGDCGGEVKAGYALLGEKDLVLIVEFPGTAEVMKATIALSKLLGISFATSPAVSVEEFDKLIERG